MIIDIADYRRLKGETADFKDYLRAGPDFDDLDLTRSAELPRGTDWAAEAGPTCSTPTWYRSYANAILILES